MRFFFLSITLMVPFGSISPMSPEEYWRYIFNIFNEINYWKSMAVKICWSWWTCMEPAIFYGFSCQFRTFVVAGKNSLPSQTYLTTRRIPKWIVAHFWNLLQAQLIVYTYRTNSSNHAHFIRKAKSSRSTSFGQPWKNYPQLSDHFNYEYTSCIRIPWFKIIHRRECYDGLCLYTYIQMFTAENRVVYHSLGLQKHSK